MSLSLGDDKHFFRPKHNIYAFFIILFGLFDSILLFVCKICHVNCETEKERNLFEKSKISLCFVWLTSY